MSAPTLSHPDPSRQFVVEVSASDVVTAGCAFSWHQSPAEANYDVGNFFITQRFTL